MSDEKGDPDRLVIASGRAGGTLAAAVAIACWEKGLLLIDPACDVATEYPS